MTIENVILLLCFLEVQAAVILSVIVYFRKPAQEFNEWQPSTEDMEALRAAEEARLTRGEPPRMEYSEYRKHWESLAQ